MLLPLKPASSLLFATFAALLLAACQTPAGPGGAGVMGVGAHGAVGAPGSEEAPKP